MLLKDICDIHDTEKAVKKDDSERELTLEEEHQGLGIPCYVEGTKSRLGAIQRNVCIISS